MRYIPFLLLLIGCSSKAPHVHSKTDTLKVNVVYVLDTSWHKDSAVRIVRDTFKLDKIDSSTGNAQLNWLKDTTYFIPLIDKFAGTVRWFGVPPKFIQEVNIQPLKTK